MHRIAAYESLLVDIQVVSMLGHTGVCQEKDRRAQTGSGAKVHSEAMQLSSSKAQEIRFQERREAGAAEGQEVGSAGLFAFPWQAAEVRFKRISFHLGVCLLFLTKQLRQATWQAHIHMDFPGRGSEGRQISKLGHKGISVRLGLRRG